MKTPFLDTNVVLDLLGNRAPFGDAAAKIATMADLEQITICVSALSFATVFYALSHYETQEIVKDKIRKFKVISRTIDLTDKIIEKSLESDFKDFEYGLQYFSAIEMGCDSIITQNAKNFREATIPVLSLEEFLNTLNN